jgi:hypothetical protein
VGDGVKFSAAVVLEVGDSKTIFPSMGWDRFVGMEVKDCVLGDGGSSSRFVSVVGSSAGCEDAGGSAGTRAPLVGRRFTILCFPFLPRDLPPLVATPEGDIELLGELNPGPDGKLVPPLIASLVSEKV